MTRPPTRAASAHRQPQQVQKEDERQDYSEAKDDLGGAVHLGGVDKIIDV